jgi:DNA-binding response OmpR family regulator
VIDGDTTVSISSLLWFPAMKVSLFSGATPAAILIVDDDEVIRMLLRQFLEGEDYVVAEAENGHAALEKLGEHSFDLVILDIAMPGIDGPGVCAHIRSSMDDPPPVLMVTALDDEKSIERSYNAGAVDYIRKPLRWPVLKNRIRYILGSHRAKQELELLTRNYEMILDAAANGICGVDGKGAVSYINPCSPAHAGLQQ